eukprot:Hpha_TRINITY_DN5687_c0_g1::TRINITY_DN5687_c0_g1_i1::g.50752::m.50752
MRAVPGGLAIFVADFIWGKLPYAGIPVLAIFNKLVRELALRATAALYGLPGLLLRVSHDTPEAPGCCPDPEPEWSLVIRHWWVAPAYPLHMGMDLVELLVAGLAEMALPLPPLLNVYAARALGAAIVEPLKVIEARMLAAQTQAMLEDIRPSPTALRVPHRCRFQRPSTGFMSYYEAVNSEGPGAFYAAYLWSCIGMVAADVALAVPYVLISSL